MSLNVKNLLLLVTAAALAAPMFVSPAQAASGPDLIVDELIVRVRQVQGSSICAWKLVAKVKNVGDTIVTDDFWVRARLNGGDGARQTQVTRNVRPGRTVRVTIFRRLDYSTSTRNYGAHADFFADVTESNEGNNTADFGNVTCP
jgi:hypothetical protein